MNKNIFRLSTLAAAVLGISGCLSGGDSKDSDNGTGVRHYRFLSISQRSCGHFAHRPCFDQLGTLGRSRHGIAC